MKSGDREPGTSPGSRPALRNARMARVGVLALVVALSLVAALGAIHDAYALYRANIEIGALLSRKDAEIERRVQLFHAKLAQQSPQAVEQFALDRLGMKVPDALDLQVLQ